MNKRKYFFLLLFLIIFFQLIFGYTSLANDTNNIGSSSNNVTAGSSNEIPQNSITEEKIETYSPACILMEASTGRILYEKNARESNYPASTTKIMTAILALEKCKLSEVATVSHDAIFTVPVGYSHANLREGEQLTIEQLLNVLLIPSANDAANVIAEHISGTVADFADLMNEKAKEIGCQNTHFVNPNGVHNKEHTTTAYDLALMGKYAMENSTFRDIVKKTRYSLPATEKYPKTNRIFNTTNDLIKEDNSTSKKNYYYQYANGIKTGYTDEAGSCIIAGAKKDNMQVIVVILGGDTTKDGLSQRYLDCKTLFNYAFDNYTLKTVNEENSVLKQVQVSGATEDTKNLDVLVKDNIEILMSKTENPQSLEPKIEINKLKAPIAAGSSIGKITYTIDENTYSSELIAKNSVVASGFLPILLRILLIFVTLYLLYLLLKPKNRGTSGNNRKSKNKNKSRNDGDFKNNSSRGNRLSKNNSTKSNRRTGNNGLRSKKQSKKSKSTYKNGKRSKGGNYRFTQINNL